MFSTSILLRGCHTLTNVQHSQNVFTHPGYNSLNFGFRVKIPIVQLNCENITGA